MLNAILPVRSLLLAIFMLMAGGGFMTTLVSVRLERAGSSAMVIGLVGTAYFAGLVVGSLRAARVIRRVGHIRAFAAFVGMDLGQHADLCGPSRSLCYGPFCASATASAWPASMSAWKAGSTSAPNRTRAAAILAGYMIALYGGQAIGPVPPQPER